MDSALSKAPKNKLNLRDFFEPLRKSLANFGKRFADGSLGTKLSHFIFGAGNFYHKQYIKGAIFLLLQLAILWFMIFCPAVNGTPYGWKALANLSLKNVKEGGEFDPATGHFSAGSDCKLMILFGFVTIAVIIIYFLIWNMNIGSSYKADMDKKIGKKPTTFIEDLRELLDSKFHVLMLTPTCIAAMVFTILPTIFMIALAFTTYNSQDMNDLGTNLFHWNGLQNFSAVFTGEGSLGVEIKNRFLPVLGWTFIWAIFATLTCYFGGIILALLINKKGLKGKKIFRTVFIFTIAVPQFISLLAVRNLLGEYGPFNAMLINAGIIDKAVGFLGLHVGDSENLAKVMVIIVNMWVGVPYTMLMTSGILMNIPTDLYEAARVDGASTLKMFFKITLPYVIFVTTPYLISSFVGNINSFNTIFLLTGGGPTYTGYQAGGTDLLVTWLYKVTIDQGSYNTGAVIGIFTFIITATITLVTYRRSKAYNEEDTFQ
ncbi:MAG: sugar ABC transporter permease [Erysipelotrichaceae bacterium]|nr:sugar ABC transporter permease [Erysipelotrichaceae bacterium]